jgi:hypothetical protein
MLFQESMEPIPNTCFFYGNRILLILLNELLELIWDYWQQNMCKITKKIVKEVYLPDWTPFHKHDE